MKKLISVVIPMYNAQNTIERCLNSILNQAYKNVEVIIVNDGSDDESQTIVEGIIKKDNRVKLFNENNHGVSHARNVGLTKVNGDYVQFVDADDDLDMDYFNKMTKLIEENDCDVAVCNNIHPFFFTHFTDRVYNLKDHDDFLSYYQHTFAPTLPWNKLYKREIVEGLHFSEDIAFAEDEVFACATLGRINKIVSTKEVLYHYFFAEKSEEQTSAMNNIIKASKFWINHTSIFYKELECLPDKLEYFDYQIKNNLIPIKDIAEVLYQRVFDYTVVEYAAYVGTGVKEDKLLMEVNNIFSNTFFHKAVNIQTRYGLVFKSFLDKDLEHYIYKFNHNLYNLYSIYQKEHNEGVNPNLCAGMLFAKYFVLENNDSTNVNILNQLDTEFKEGTSANAKFVQRILSL